MKSKPDNPGASPASKPKRLNKGVVRRQAGTLKKLMIETLQKYPVVEAACHKVGITRTTHYRWIQEDRAYAGEVVGALYASSEVVNDVCVSKLIEAAERGERWAIYFWLRNRHPQFNNDPIVRNMHLRLAKIELKEQEREASTRELREILWRVFGGDKSMASSFTQADLERQARTNRTSSAADGREKSDGGTAREVSFERERGDESPKPPSDQNQEE